jgi:Tfp pilus assembly protein PilF
MTNKGKRSAVALTTALALTACGTGTAPRQATSTEQAQPACTELAVWPLMVQTHGADEAARMWTELAAQGWTNPRSGEATYLVEPGCADAWPSA